MSPFLTLIRINKVNESTFQATDNQVLNNCQETNEMNFISSVDRTIHPMNSMPPKPNDTQPLRISNTERIISQQLKDKIFRNCCPSGITDIYSRDTFTENDESIAYARWVLENNIMSGDSEDDSGDDSSDFASLYEVAHIDIFQKRPQEKFARGSSGYPAERAFHETSLDDLFLFADSDSSDYRSSKYSDERDFPTISGEELERLLEEAKGTIQFHKWQNAPPGEHQREFKTLINLHRFSKEAQARNQKRWRSREQAEEETNIKVTAEPSHTNIAASKPGSDLQTHTVSNKKPSFPEKPSKDLESKPQPVERETEDYSHITADDIKFLRELRKKLEQKVAQQTETAFDGDAYNGLQKPQSGSAVIMQKFGEYGQIKPGRIAIADLSKKSLRDVLRTAKPLPSISHRTEYENWFPREENDCSELSRIYHDGPTPKRHHLTTPLGDVSFRAGSTHPFFQATQSPGFKKLVMSTGRLWNPRADISLSGFWATENLFVTALNFHPWVPSTNIGSLHNQIEDFKSRNEGIELFVSNNWLGPSNDPEAIKVVLRAWDTSARIAVFQIEDKMRASANFVGVDILVEEDATYSHNGAHIATIGYNPSDTARGDQLGLRLLTTGSRSVTFGQITISKGYNNDNKIHLPPVFARLEPGFSHGSYGRMCVTMDTDQKNPNYIIGLGI